MDLRRWSSAWANYRRKVSQERLRSKSVRLHFGSPHFLHMDKEFALLQEAALLAFRQEYSNREQFFAKNKKEWGYFEKLE